MNTTRKGSKAERLVRADLQEKGWIVGSRRHVKGGGDEIAVHPNGTIWLLEVKAIPRKAGRFHAFGPADRAEMRSTPLPKGAERWLVNVRGEDLEYVSEIAWPDNRQVS